MTRQRKPIDLGNGLLCASFGVEGSWLSVSTTHPEVGVVELSGATAFPSERDGQVDVVRAHRVHLIDPATALLRIVGSEPDPVGGDRGWHLRGLGWRAHADAWAEERTPSLTQRYRMVAEGPGSLRLGFRGRLQRPGYAEITPGGPIPPALPPQALEVDGATLQVRTPLGLADPTARIVVTSPVLSLGAWAGDRRGSGTGGLLGRAAHRRTTPGPRGDVVR